MSTTGKVLVVLVVLALLGWLVLFSLETKYHTSWLKEHEDLRKQPPALRDETAKAKTQVDRINQEIDLTQRMYIDQLNHRDQVRAHEDKSLVEAQEQLQRIQRRLERGEAIEQRAKAALQRKVRERDELKQQVAAAQRESDELMAANKAARGDLFRLRNRFKAVISENRRLEQRLNRQTSGRGTPASLPGGDRGGPPATAPATLTTPVR